MNGSFSESKSWNSIFPYFPYSPRPLALMCLHNVFHLVRRWWVHINRLCIYESHAKTWLVFGVVGVNHSPQLHITRRFSLSMCATIRKAHSKRQAQNARNMATQRHTHTRTTVGRLAARTQAPRAQNMFKHAASSICSQL